MTTSLSTLNLVKLASPKELPAAGVTSAQFKPWKNHLVAFLSQNPDNALFFENGVYSIWQPGSNTRLTELLGKDLTSFPTAAQVKAKACEGALPDHVPTQKELDDAKEILKMDRLLQRNNQLAMFLQQISSFCYYTEQDDVVHRSDSVDWIWRYLLSHYNIEAKGANFLRVVDHRFKPGDNPSTFFKQFRASFVDNLRKKGSAGDPRDPTDILKEDEKLSPSFEDAIFIWCLEKIDPRLPNKVRKEYEGRLHGNCFLWNLQAMILQAIPAMLAELDSHEKLAQFSAMAASQVSTLADYTLDPTLAASNAGFRGGPARGRGAARGRGRGGGRGGANAYRPWTTKYCIICHKAEKPSQVYTSHNTAECNALSVDDRNGLLAALQALDLDDEPGAEDLGDGEGQQGLQDDDDA